MKKTQPSFLFLKKIFFSIFTLVFLFIIITFLGWILDNFGTLKESFKKTDLSGNDIINCSLSLSTSVRVEDWAEKKIIAEANKMENPSNVTITWILWENPKIKWDMWDEVEVTKISTSDSILLLERAGENIHTWTFFPKSWILIVSKAYDLMVPYGSQVIWSCK